MGLFTVQIQKVFDYILVFSQNGEQAKDLMISIGILATIKVSSEASSVLSNYFGGKYYRISSAYFIDQYNLKHAHIEPIAYENESELNGFRKALEGSTVARNQLHVIMDVLTFYIPYFLVISHYLFELKPILLIIMLLMFVPVIYSNKIKKKNHNQLENEVSQIVREKDQYFDYIGKYENLKESRTLKAFDFFK